MKNRLNYGWAIFFWCAASCCGFAESSNLDQVKNEEGKPGIADSSSEAAEESPSSEKDKEELSLGRQILGYAVLAFLIGWMFYRSSKNRRIEDDGDGVGSSDDKANPN